MSAEVVVGYRMQEGFRTALASQGLKIPVLDPLPFKVSLDAEMKAPPYATIDFAKEMPDGEFHSLLDWERDAEDFSGTIAAAILHDPFLSTYERAALLIDEDHPENSGKGVIHSFSAYNPHHTMFRQAELNPPPKGNEVKPPFMFEMRFQFGELIYCHYFAMCAANPEMQGFVPSTTAMKFFLERIECSTKDLLDNMVRTDAAVRRVENGYSIFCTSPDAMCRDIVVPDKELWRLPAAVTSVRCVGSVENL